LNEFTQKAMNLPRIHGKLKLSIFGIALDQDRSHLLARVKPIRVLTDLTPPDRDHFLVEEILNVKPRSARREPPIAVSTLSSQDMIKAFLSAGQN
jgi:hypothetical protein